MNFRLAPLALALLGSVVACGDATTPLGPKSRSAMVADCDLSQVDYCQSDPYYPYTPPPPAHGVLTGWNPTTCRDVTSYPDTDRDGLNDLCEEALAAAFAPELYQSPSAPGYDHVNHWTGGEYYHAVAQQHCDPGPCTNDVTIMYMPAYYVDTGTNPSYNTTIFDVPLNDWVTWDGGHDGDSEFIVIPLEYSPSSGRYMTHDVFLSAHCGVKRFWGNADPDCRWWSYSNIIYQNGVFRGPPAFWVARGTNANYRSADACRTGTYHMEECYDFVPMRFPVSFEFNIGSPANPVHDVHAKRTADPLLVSATRTESFWNETGIFNGWQDFQDDTTPYGKILRTFGLFYLPYTPPVWGGWGGGGGGGGGGGDEEQMMQSVSRTGPALAAGGAAAGAPGHVFGMPRSGRERPSAARAGIPTH